MCLRYRRIFGLAQRPGSQLQISAIFSLGLIAKNHHAPLCLGTMHYPFIHFSIELLPFGKRLEFKLFQMTSSLSDLLLISAFR